MNSNKEIVRFTDVSMRKAALIGGFALLLMSVLAPIGYYGIIQKLIVPENPAATVSNIKASIGLFRIGIGCLLINAVLDLVVAWALYIVLKQVNKSIALLTAWFRVVYTVILLVALSHFVMIIQSVSGLGYLATIGSNQLYSNVMFHVAAFENSWNIGFVLFGFHLIMLGYLVFKAGYLPKFLGILIQIAGFGYLMDALGTVFFSNYDLTIASYTFIGEPLLLIWLLVIGFKRGSKLEKLKE